MHKDMILTLFSLAFLSSTAPAQAAKPQVSCSAVYRSLDERNNTVESTAEVPVKAVLGARIKHELSFAGRTFLLTEDRGDLFGQIVAPGDDAKGVSLKAAPDSLGHFSIAEISGFTAYRLDCQRN